MPSLWFDGDVRRVYEVPDDSTFIVDGGGYRVYTPNNLLTADLLISFTAVEFWSAWVDYHEANKWSTLALERSGGGFRNTTNVGDNYAVTELRFINQWQYVVADYRHVGQLDGNFLPDETVGFVFDTERITATPPPEVKILFADRGQFTQLAATGTGDRDCDHPTHLDASLVGTTTVSAAAVSTPQLAATLD